MPSLAEMFGALSTDADRVPRPELAAIHSRGRQRQVGRIVAAAAVGVLVLLAGTAVGVRVIGAPRPVPAAPVPAGFQRLEQIGVEVPFGATPPATTPVVSTAISGGRGFAVWTTGGQATAVAVDLRTGKAAWGPRPVGGHGPGAFAVLAGGLLVVGAQTPLGDNDSRVTVTALDPSTGDQLWQHDLDLNHDNALIFPSVLVLANYSSGETRAIDWQTGGTIWSMTDPDHALDYAMGLATESDIAAGTADGLHFTDPRLVEANGDGNLRVYDSATGRLMATRPAPEGRQAIGFDGTVFAASQRSTGQRVVSEVELAGGPVHEIYVGTRPVDSQDLTMSPCGGGLLCLVDASSVSGLAAAGGAGPGDPLAQLVAVDPHTGHQAWHRVTGDLASLIPVGDKVFGLQGATIGLYGAEVGRTVVAQNWGGQAVPVGGERALLLIPPAAQPGGDSNIARPTDVSGLLVGSGTSGGLGRVDIAPTHCSAAGGSLFCPTPTGIRLWRYGMP